MEIKKLGVIGAGQMGAGIAEVAAVKGIQVWVNDVADAYIQKGLDKIGANLQRLVSKGKLEQDAASLQESQRLRREEADEQLMGRLWALTVAAVLFVVFTFFG